MLRQIKNLLIHITYIRYLAASIVALGVDITIFLILLNTGMGSVIASATGYSIGILTHWLMSSRTVFADRVSERGSQQRLQQKAMFVISALLGLLATMAIIGIGESLNIDARLAKLAAIAVSFQLTYFLRNSLIFRNS